MVQEQSTHGFCKNFLFYFDIARVYIEIRSFVSKQMDTL